jgi:hypothetical protein
VKYLPKGKREIFCLRKTLRKKAVEAARLQPLFVLLKAFCVAKSYLDLRQRRNIIG